MPPPFPPAREHGTRDGEPPLLYHIARLHWQMNICLPLLLVLPVLLLWTFFEFLDSVIFSKSPSTRGVVFLVAFPAVGLSFLAVNFWALKLSVRMAATLWNGFVGLGLVAVVVWIPWLNFIVLFAMSISAGRRLRTSGVRIGFMGVPRADRDRLRAGATTAAIT